MRKWKTHHMFLVFITVILLILFLTVISKAQVAVTPAVPPKLQFFDENGAPLSFGKVYTYLAGTTTPTPTYTDYTGTSQNPNPIILDAGGFASIWLASQGYKFAVTDQNNNQLYVIDGISPSGVPFGGNNNWTGNQTFAGSSTFNGSVIINNGGTFSGAFLGNPTFSGTLTFSGNPLFSGNPVFSGSPNFQVNLLLNNVAQFQNNPSAVTINSIPGTLYAVAHNGVGWLQTVDTSGNMGLSGTLYPGAINTAGQITSTAATGVAPFVVSSTTPVANLTAVPVAYNAAGTQLTVTPHVVVGSVTSSASGSQTITLSGSAVFTSQTSYACVVNDTANQFVFGVEPMSGTSFVIWSGSSITDVINYSCTGY